MAKVPEELGCQLDTHIPGEPEDFTEWEIDAETKERIDALEATDIHGPTGWDGRGDDS